MGPAYMDGYWSTTVEGRPLYEFVRLPDRNEASIWRDFLSSNSDADCQPIQKSRCYQLSKPISRKNLDSTATIIAQVRSIHSLCNADVLDLLVNACEMSPMIPRLTIKRLQ